MYDSFSDQQRSEMKHNLMYVHLCAYREQFTFIHHTALTRWNMKFGELNSFQQKKKKIHILDVKNYTKHYKKNISIEHYCSNTQCLKNGCLMRPAGRGFCGICVHLHSSLAMQREGLWELWLWRCTQGSTPKKGESMGLRSDDTVCECGLLEKLA